MFSFCCLQFCRLSFVPYVIKLGLKAESSMGGLGIRRCNGRHSQAPGRLVAILQERHARNGRAGVACLHFYTRYFFKGSQ